VEYKIGRTTLIDITAGRLSAGGEMLFGDLNLNIATQSYKTDNKGRLKIPAKCLFVDFAGKIIIVDTGLGDGYSEEIVREHEPDGLNGLAGALKNLRIRPENVYAVVLTHLHFDHAGGNTILIGKSRVPFFSKAKYFVQAGEIGESDGAAAKGDISYRKIDIEPIKERRQLETLAGDAEIIPGISCIVTGGHCKNHQIVTFDCEEKSAVAWGDLIPTAIHLNDECISKFDLFPMETAGQKRRLFSIARDENWLMHFPHEQSSGLLWGGEAHANTAVTSGAHARHVHANALQTSSLDRRPVI
jgi:glyoxylase-like metal-dependent hydrolase (beta-lactamase superfamily II)